MLEHIIRGIHFSSLLSHHYTKPIYEIKMKSDCYNKNLFVTSEFFA